MAKPQTVWIDWDGHRFQVFVGANGAYYLHDPDHKIDAEHFALPTIPRITKQDGRLGLSPEGAIAGNLVPAALSFVPVVGPVLGPLAGALAPIIGGMFGGNDPTPAGDIEARAIQLRQGIVDANKQLGIADQMPTLPPGVSYRHPYSILPILLELWPENAGINDNNHWTCDWSGVNCDGCGNMRKCFYAAVNKLTPIYQGKMAQLQDKKQQDQIAMVAKLTAAVAPAAQPSPVNTGPTPTFATPLPPPPPPQPVYKPTQALFPGGGGAINWGTPATDPDLQPPPPPAPVAQAGFPPWALPLLLVAIPVTIGLMGQAAPPPAPVKTAPVRKARRAA